MDSDSPATECMAAEQPTPATARFFTLGWSFGTKSEFGSRRTRPVQPGGRAVAGHRRRHHREPDGHGPAP